MFFNNLDKRGLFLFAFFSGLMLILCSIYVSLFIPKDPVISNHSNLNSTILSLELIENKADLDNLIGIDGNPKNQIYSDNFIKSVEIDNFYIFTYSLYFLSLFEIGFRFHSFSKRFQFLFYSILISCILFDLLENYKIITILNTKSPVEIVDSIQNLRLISLCKWFLVFLISAVIGILFWLSKDNFLFKTSGLLLFTSFVACLPGMFRVSLIEIASYIMSFGLFLSWVCIIQKNCHFLFRK